MTFTKGDQMKHCENCGAKLQEGMKFCGNCGSPVPVEEPLESKGQEDGPKLETTVEKLMNPEPASPPAGNKKKIVITVAVIVAILAAIAIALWQSGVFSEQEKPATKDSVQAIDQNDLRGTLDWKEDQDKEYALKNSLIEGNADSNVKEIFEESAYFMPTKHTYAINENVTYYSIDCEYKKDDKVVPYVLVFQVNQDEHLELAELYKNDKKVNPEKFDDFYEKLYTTKEDLAAAEEARAVAEKEANPYAYMKGLTYAFNPDEGDGIPEDVYIDNVEEDSIVLTMSSGISTMEHLVFYRNGPVGSTEYECHQYGKVINLYIYDENSIGINFAEADGTDYGLTVYVRQ